MKFYIREIRVEEIIDKATNICMEYQRKKMQEGLDYNIFSLLEVERRELKTHEYMIYSIMNMGKERALPISFTNFFLEAMNLPKKFLSGSWSVEKEYYAGKEGRIDLFLKNKGKEKFCVVVEIKIDATDQDLQLKRYENFVTKASFDDYRIIYLTLNGKEATEVSLKGVKNFDKIMNCSFGEHILKWLDRCMEICEEECVDTSYIKQYELLVKKITGEEYMENEVKELIQGSERVKACIVIANALEEVKASIVTNFFDALSKKKKTTECIPFWDAGRITKGLYALWKIRDITVQQKCITIGISVWIEEVLYYEIMYFDENLCIIDSNEFKGRNKRIAEKVETAIEEALNIKVRDNKYYAIAYFPVKGTKNKSFDFIKFNDSCVELADKDTMNAEVNYIAGNISDYIKLIGEKLDLYLEDRIC